jgi:ligand-binding SRPBCC domain-containing protein
MQIYTLECEMITPQSIEDTFAIFENPYNLAKITPPELGFQIISKQKVEMRCNAEIEYRIKWLGFAMYWKTLITRYEPPFMFEDEQAKGPYTLWRHRHTFAATAGGTKVGDHVDYVLPLGPFGRAAHGLMVGQQLKKIFVYRQDQLSKLLGGGTIRTREPGIRAVNLPAL